MTTEIERFPGKVSIVVLVNGDGKKRNWFYIDGGIMARGYRTKQENAFRISGYEKSHRDWG